MKTSMNYYSVNMLMGVLLLLSCNSKTQNEHQDYFYTDIGGGTKRIPLIKPYEVKKITENEWRLELQTTQLLELSIHNVKSVNIIDSVIVVHAMGDVSIKGITCSEGWFVILPSRKVEKGFASETEFFTYLNEAGVKFSKFYYVDDIFNTFNKNKKINWRSLQ